MHFTLPPMIQRAPARLSLTALCALSACLFAACGGGGGDPSGGLGSVSGVLSGLEQGKSLVLQNNGGDDLALSANGAFGFAQPMALGAAYAVTVKTQPAGQQCTVGQGTGTLAATPTNVRVDCVSAGAGFTLGGTVSGVPGGQAVVLTTAGGEDLALAADGAFTFARRLAAGASYLVTVKTAPAGSGCVVRNGSGVVAAAAVNTVAVRCAPLAMLPDGEWQHDRCQPSASGGVRDLWRLSIRGEGWSSVDVAVGTVNYPNGQCDGEGVASDPRASSRRSFWFQPQRSEAGAGLAVFWGNTQAFPYGHLVAPVWTRVALVRKANHLCLLDEPATLSTFSTAASLEPVVTSAIAAGQCFSPR